MSPSKRKRMREMESLARLFLAGIGTCAIFGLLAWLFAPRGLSSGPTLNTRSTSAVAVPLSPNLYASVDAQEQEPAWVEDMRAWLIINNPTVLVVPQDVDKTMSHINVLYQVRRAEFVPPHLDYQPANSPEYAVEFPPLVLAPLVPYAADPLASIEESRWQRPPALDQVVPPRRFQAPTDRALVLDRFEKPVADLPPITLQAVTDSGATQVDGPTVLHIIPMPPGARVAVIRSSGAGALDDLAVAHFRLYARRLQAMKTDPDEIRHWLDQEHIYQIHWHHLPAISRRDVTMQLPEPKGPPAWLKPSADSGAAATAPPAEPEASP